MQIQNWHNSSCDTECRDIRLTTTNKGSLKRKCQKEGMCKLWLHLMCVHDHEEGLEEAMKKKSYTIQLNNNPYITLYVHRKLPTGINTAE